MGCGCKKHNMAPAPKPKDTSKTVPEKKENASKEEEKK